MTRSISQTASDHVAGAEIRFAVLLELGFDSGPVNLWSGTGELAWAGKTWIGTGEMGSISGVTEATDLSDTVIKATLSHLDRSVMPDLVREMTEMQPVGRPFTLYLAFFEPDGAVSDAVTLTSGLIDAVELADGEAGAIIIDLVSEAGLLNRTLYYRLDDQHQQKLFPGDKGFQFVAGLDGQIAFGAAPVRRIENKFLTPEVR